jgi:hypothetical protein
MTDLELIKDFGRQTVLQSRALAHFSRRVVEDIEGSWLSSPDANLLASSSQAVAYYNFTDALARHMPIDLALDAWRDALERLREMLAEWDPGFREKGSQSIVDADYHRGVLTDLVTRAQLECRIHEETLHLLDSPANAKRLSAAIAEADSGLAREMTSEQLRAAGGH